VGDVPFHPKWAIEVTHPPLWKSLTSTDNNEFARRRHSVPFWQHHNYISYLLWRWPLLSFRVGFSCIVRIICDGLCTLSKYRFWILIVDFFRYTKHLHLVAPLVPKSVTSYSIWPLASYFFRWFLRPQHELTIWFANWEMCNTRSVNCAVTNNCRLADRAVYRAHLQPALNDQLDWYHLPTSTAITVATSFSAHIKHFILYQATEVHLPLLLISKLRLHCQVTRMLDSLEECRWDAHLPCLGHWAYRWIYNSLWHTASTTPDLWLSSQPQCTAPCLVVISRPTEVRRLSWPKWLVTYQDSIPENGHPSRVISKKLSNSTTVTMIPYVSTEHKFPNSSSHFHK